MYYTVYKITNNINYKIYIGVHITSNLNDDYMGSGLNIYRAIKKHGVENFTKKILFVFDNEQDMFNKEKELVTEEFCSRIDTYNIMPGGNGGWDYVNKLGLQCNLLEPTHPKIIEGKKRFFANQQKVELWKLRLSNSLKGKSSGEKNSMFGKKHTKEARNKMKNLGNHKGVKNSQYGTCWITNGSDNKKIKKEELDKWIELGYSKGRFLNK